MAHVIAFANHKGGATKTTSTANLGAALVEQRQRVLLIDGDPQMNLTDLFAAGHEPGQRLEHLLARPATDPRPLERLSVATDGEGARPLWGRVFPGAIPGGVHLLPCSDELAEVAMRLVGRRGYEKTMRRVIEPLRQRYDFILIDTPPGVGILSGLALIAADGVIVPSRPADHDINGAVRIHDLVERSFRAPDVNPRLAMLGVLVACVDQRWRVRRECHELLESLRIPVLPVEVPLSVRVAQAPRYGAPTFVLEPDGNVAYAYRALARHLVDAADRAPAGAAAP